MTLRELAWAYAVIALASGAALVKVGVVDPPPNIKSRRLWWVACAVCCLLWPLFLGAIRIDTSITRRR